MQTLVNVGLRLHCGSGAEWLSLSAITRGPGFEYWCHRKCWAVLELFVNIYLYEFMLCLVCVCIRCFGLY